MMCSTTAVAHEHSQTGGRVAKTTDSAKQTCAFTKQKFHVICSVASYITAFLRRHFFNSCSVPGLVEIDDESCRNDHQNK